MTLRWSLPSKRSLGERRRKRVREPPFKTRVYTDRTRGKDYEGGLIQKALEVLVGTRTLKT